VIFLKRRKRKIKKPVNSDIADEHFVYLNQTPTPQYEFFDEIAKLKRKRDRYKYSLMVWQTSHEKMKKILSLLNKELNEKRGQHGFAKRMIELNKEIVNVEARLNTNNTAIESAEDELEKIEKKLGILSEKVKVMALQSKQISLF
jgi:chromosome segregation ATPase